ALNMIKLERDINMDTTDNTPHVEQTRRSENGLDNKELTLEDVKQELYNRHHPSLTFLDIEVHAKTVHKIRTLKQKHDVVMLGHNYMEPLVFGLSDKEEQGDSLGLSMYAAKSESPYLIFNGVPFMAETAKILSPDKTVLVADKTAGCSLADNFGAEDVRKLKALYPDAPVMIYVNSYADAKAESDICCTSANAAHIAKSMPGDTLIFVPDIFFAQNLEEELKGEKNVVYPGKDNTARGAVCEVHEKFTLSDLLSIRESFEIPKGHSKRKLYAHWECRPNVLKEADFYGSTSQIMKDIAGRVAEDTLERAFVASECELTSNLAQEFPKVQFWTACSVRCSHMAKVRIDKIGNILEAIDTGDDLSEYEVTLDPDVIEKARIPIERMLEASV
ncbi:quinolinate synthase NadA, partial [Candidatus Poribacteria bacterium]|nr:quinolinate synthase NadA [Candidatus Poribacteria bacterium]